MNTELKQSDQLTSCTACTKTPQCQMDFPIEWEGDHYVSRREMVKFLTLGSGILAIANWVTVFAKGLVRHDSKSVKHLGPVGDLERQDALLFRYPTEQDPCIAVRTPEGKFVAYSQVCTHLSCAVVYDKSENQLVCPCHRGVFSIDEGAPIAGPPTRPLPRIRIEQRGDQIFAVGTEG
jgi:nitrite reductase/ring-hydroxylating ferredoxin subunit